MKLRLFAVSAALLSTSLLTAVVRAQSDIYLCVDDEGHKTYTNTGNTKGCKRQEIAPVVTVPGPRLPARNAGGNGLEQRATPANYPRVDDDTQRARDGDRRRILEDELRAEEDRVARLREEFNNGEPERRGDERNYARYQERVQRLQEDIQRGENNIVALRREIAALRQ
ncbi:MAG TPA: DUF4124 domain-containing protein [Burkholderiaceae bacterium]|nr:DUF4124 domain-containing protein [Burkholderiaceae bacterium]